MSRKTCWRYLFGGTLAVCCWLTPAAAPAEIGASASTRVVEAEGQAAILVDPVSARDRALIDARVKAVEQGVGTDVHAQALYSMGLSQQDFVRIRAFGFVEKYELLKEQQHPDRYDVTIKAWVTSGERAEQEKTKQLLSQRGFLVLGNGDGARQVVEQVKSRLLENGLQVYDEQFLGARLPPGAGQRELLAAAEYVLADYVVRVNSNLTALGEMFGIKSYQGEARIELTEISSGLIKATARADGKVFGLSPEQALAGSRPDQYRKAVAEPAVQQFLAQLEGVDIGSRRSVQLVLENASSQYALDRLVNGVSELRWVQNPHNASFEGNRATLQVEYPEKILYLAADLDYLPGFSVISYGPGRVVLREEG